MSVVDRTVLSNPATNSMYLCCYFTHILLYLLSILSTAIINLIAICTINIKPESSRNYRENANISKVSF